MLLWQYFKLIESFDNTVEAVLITKRSGLFLILEKPNERNYRQTSCMKQNKLGYTKTRQ
jgi:hypothetical protein